MSYFLVMTSSANNRAGHGPYGNVAVVEAEDGLIPLMISPCAKGLIRIVRKWGPLHIGNTERGAFQRARKEAEALADELNHA
jgi:hypothetical protein